MRLFCIESLIMGRQSIRKTGEYKAVYRGGVSLAKGPIVVYIEDNGRAFNRLGISAGRSIGNSVIRHRFIRRIREIFRANDAQVKKGQDIVVVARGRAGETSYRRLNECYISLMREHGLWTEDEERGT